MLTEVEERWTNFVLTVGCKLAVIPCDWNSETFRLSRTKSRRKRWCERITAVYTFFYVCFEIYRFPVTIKRFQETRKSGMLMFHCLVFLRDLANFALRINTYLYMDDIIILINQTFALNKSVAKSVLKQEFLPKQLREKFFIGCQAMLAIAGLSLYSVFFVKPNVPNYLYSALDPAYKNPIVFLIFAGLEVILSTNVALVGFNLLVLFVHLLSMNFWLQRICIDWPQEGIITAERSIQIYRSFAVLNRIYNQTYSKLVAPGLKYIMSCAAMVTFFSGVTNYDIKSIEANLCIMIAFSCYFQLIPGAHIMANLHSYSSQYEYYMLLHVVPNLVTNINKRYIRKSIKSCRSIQCKIGSVYHMDKHAKATLIDFLSNGTIFLFLTYK